MAKTLTPAAGAPQSGDSSENRGNHTSPPQNAAGNGSQRAVLGCVLAGVQPLQVGGEEEGSSPPRYDAILVQPGWIRNADGTDSDWLIPADVLQDAGEHGPIRLSSLSADAPGRLALSCHLAR